MFAFTVLVDGFSTASKTSTGSFSKRILLLVSLTLSSPRARVSWTNERNSTARHNRERSHRRLIAASKDTLPQSETDKFQLAATLLCFGLGEPGNSFLVLFHPNDRENWLPDFAPVM